MKLTLCLLTALAIAVPSLPAMANPGPSASAATVTRSLDKTGAVLILARRGADDPATHDRFDDKGGKRVAKGGKRRGGRDDGANHA